MADYFNKLPIISYGDFYSRNLMAKVSFSKKTKDNLTIFYPYTLKENESRADIVSSKYFDDPFYAWVIYMSNDTVDPYYDLGLTQDQFESYIVKKYGSLEEATKKILFYRNDWSSDESIISLSTYEALPGSRKKYYNPVIGYNNQITGYARKREDWKVATNKVFGLQLTGNATFQIGETITQYKIGNMHTDGTFIVRDLSSTIIATGTILSGNNSYYTVGNVSNNFNVADISIITGASSNTNYVVSDCNLLSVNIPDDESFYWAPVSAYDYEAELNTQKRNIQLLDNRFVADVEAEVKALLK